MRPSWRPCGGYRNQLPTAAKRQCFRRMSTGSGFGRCVEMSALARFDMWSGPHDGGTRRCGEVRDTRPCVGIRWQTRGVPKPPRIEPSADVVARIAATALALPDAYEEDAWTGVRWRIRNKTFAHVLVAQEGYTSAYRDVTGVTEPTTVLTFRSCGDELVALANAGPPFYRPPWSPTVIGMALGADTSWDEVAELVTDSYRCCAPQRLRHQLDP